MRAQAFEHLDSSIVISGAALATCLGLDRREVWQAIRSGRCGVGPLTQIDSPAAAGLDGGQVTSEITGENTGSPRVVRYLRHVLRDAMGDAGFGRASAETAFEVPYPRRRCGIILGTTLHGMRSGGQFLREKNASALKHFLAASVVREASAGLGLEGPALTTCSACSSSLGSIALAVTLLQAGHLDLVAAGGYDPISEYVYAGFNSLRLVASGPVRPFARDRAGMKVGEGYAIVILEREKDAQRRGHPASLARIVGFGESADAYHLTHPHPEGDGAARAIEAALKSAGISREEIDLIAAHGTATPDNDAGEYAALRRVWGEDLPRVPLVAFKSHLSHTLGAAGAVELILSSMALEDQTAPPCANVGPDDSDFEGLRVATGEAQAGAIRNSLNLSLGFGGANTCMIVGRSSDVSEPKSIRRATNREAWITGIGVVLPGAVGNDQFIRRWREPGSRIVHDTPQIDEARIAQLLHARRVRRMSPYVKLSLAAAMLALEDAGVRDIAEFGESCCALLGSTHGSIQYCHDYYEQIVREGIAAANPLLFAEGVPNAAAAHLSLAIGIKGGCQTIIGSRTAGIDALGLAAARIASGQWDRAVVGAAEEYSPLLHEAYSTCGLIARERDATPPFACVKRGEPGSLGGAFAAGCGAVAYILESRASLERRGANMPVQRVCASVEDYASASASEGQSVAAIAGILEDLGNPTAVLSSANGTWIDRLEASAIRQAARQSSQATVVSSISGHIAECFSAGSLAAIAGVILTGRFPRLFGELSDEESFLAPGEEPIDQFAALASDYAGLVSGIRIQVHRRGASA